MDRLTIMVEVTNLIFKGDIVLVNQMISLVCHCCLIVMAMIILRSPHIHFHPHNTHPPTIVAYLLPPTHHYCHIHTIGGSQISLTRDHMTIIQRCHMTSITDHMTRIDNHTTMRGATIMNIMNHVIETGVHLIDSTHPHTNVIEQKEMSIIHHHVVLEEAQKQPEC